MMPSIHAKNNTRSRKEKDSERANSRMKHSCMPECVISSTSAFESVPANVRASEGSLNVAVRSTLRIAVLKRRQI